MQLKTLHQKQLEDTFLQNLSYEEWLKYFQKEPTSKELDDIEKQINKPNRFSPRNNTNYQPLQGA